MASYPREFTREAQNRIDTAKVEAWREFERVIAEPPPKDISVEQWKDRTVKKYLFTFVFAFATEARKCKQQGLWTIGRAEQEIMEYAAAFAYGQGERHDRLRGWPRAFLASRESSLFEGISHRLHPQVERELRATPEWRAHEDDLLADKQASPEQPAIAAAPKSRGGRPKGIRLYGQKLRQLREAKKLSQAGFGETCNPQVSEDSIQRAENEETIDPKTVDTIVRALTALGYSSKEAEAIKRPQ